MLGEPALKKKKLRDARNEGVQIAQQRERQRIEQDNAKRYEDGQAPMSRARAEGRVKAAGEQALRDLARKNRMVSVATIAPPHPSEDLAVTMIISILGPTKFLKN